MVAVKCEFMVGIEFMFIPQCLLVDDVAYLVIEIVVISIVLFLSLMKILINLWSEVISLILPFDFHTFVRFLLNLFEGIQFFIIFLE